MYQLYSLPGSCSTGIHTLLNRYGQPVDIILRSEVADYPALVPTNQVPALRADGELLTEGAAIALMLIERHGALPAGEEQTFRQWLMFNYATLHPAYSKLFTASALMDPGAQQDALMTQLAGRVSELWAIVEARLEGRQWMVGGEPGIVDYLLAMYSNWGNHFAAYPISIGPRARALIERVSVLPEFVTALQREQVAFALPEPAAA